MEPLIKSEALLSTDTSKILYDPKLLPEPKPSLFDLMDQPNTLDINTLGRGTAFFLEIDEKTCVLKHYNRGGLVRFIFRDRYFYQGFEKTRMVQEFRLLQTLQKQGLPAPIPLAARVCRHGAFYCGDLITVCIDGTRTLAEVLSTETLPRHIWEVIGRTIADFHHHHVFHADLNANNILLDDNTAYLIDFDKSVIRPEGVKSWRQHNLARLLRSLEKIKANMGQLHYSAEDWQNLVAAYNTQLSSTN